MTQDTKHELKNSAGRQSLETADAVARATHLWIRSLCMNEMQAAGERHALAGGLVAGLCERLALDPRIRELVEQDNLQAIYSEYPVAT